MAQDTVRKTISDVQSALELAISAIGENVNQINNWVKETVEELNKINLKRSRVTSANDPFLKGGNNMDEALGANS